jgi:hypothetical protein
VPNGAVSRLYIPKWFALTMPETYAVAAVLGLLSPLPWRRPRAAETRVALLQTGWLALVAVPVAWWSCGVRRFTTACGISFRRRPRRPGACPLPVLRRGRGGWTA